jgi:steroid 5-alpha reductase family enzyme
MYRLSYNTWRRGLFNLRDEDYRWVVLRAKVCPFIFQVLNLVFVCELIISSLKI